MMTLSIFFLTFPNFYEVKLYLEKLNLILFILTLIPNVPIDDGYIVFIKNLIKKSATDVFPFVPVTATIFFGL